MDWQALLSLGLTAGVLLALITTRLPAHVVLMTALAILSLAGVLTPTEALAGFANPGLITVAAMFAVAAGLHGSGGIDLLVNRFLGKPQSIRGAMLRLFLPVLPLSAFLNNTPVVATMIPAINSWSRKIGIAPSRLLIPLSYAAIVGGTLTMIGTSTNLVVSGQYQSLTGNDAFGIFSITMIGLPVALVSAIFMLLVLPRVLPDRSARRPFANMREFTVEVAVDPHGPLVGLTVEKAGLRDLERLYLVEISRGDSVVTAAPSEETLLAGDRLVFAGETEAVTDLLRINGLTASAGENTLMQQDRAERRLIEVVVSQSCAAVGETIRSSRFHDRYGAVVMALARNGERIEGNLGNIIIKPGDTLLLEARPAFVTRQQYNKDFLVVNDLDKVAPRHEKAGLAWTILLLAVGAAGMNLVSMLDAALIAVGVMMATGCLTISQAEKSLELPVLITIAASFALGAALQKTGVAAALALAIVELSGGRPWLLLVLIYAAVSLLTEVITNNAAAVIMVPLALAITQQAGLDPEPFMFAIMVAASASFATPLGYQTNLMVYGPGSYRFSDFLRAGIPMNIIVGVTTLTVLLLFYPLQ
ncbi:SLC13 family permease [Pseudohongiella sp. SYSU M77423]|uniref:SLC13 family permease n=1 Tax=unclassified Pseudohongiella TaxID=2629611 RepID=UPI001F02CFDF|nr:MULTISPECIES: SLC13 family permease [unclassified Pseudohongiella]MDH7943959.1 SLC13 family permease [Pseudohongiella sp. SYSU M77423]